MICSQISKKLIEKILLSNLCLQDAYNSSLRQVVTLSGIALFTLAFSKI